MTPPTPASTLSAHAQTALVAKVAEFEQALRDEAARVEAGRNRGTTPEVTEQDIEDAYLALRKHAPPPPKPPLTFWKRLSNSSPGIALAIAAALLGIATANLDKSWGGVASAVLMTIIVMVAVIDVAWVRK